ncbi:hypothetical protein GH714_002857 [Hevea brasiliensis]|uniref:Wall-associated receptor kinase galacturonan-binding domain-containing protein n=1 Tax=Hevea brasiliensis TaxID=3981 RepID=A0A6A6LFD4_HEVBR|nr:hypothetical protein GH714_002857 [Hevea brasiliensis]
MAHTTTCNGCIIGKPVCQQNCGSVNFYFPFGIGEGCYMNKSFEVVCNDSFTPPKPFLASINMELLASYDDAVLVNNPVIHSDCSDEVSANRGVNMSGTGFFYSNDANRFTATGCDNYAMLVQNGRKSAFMVFQDSFESRSLDEVLQRDHVPAMIEWARFQGNCDLSEL